jgi:protein associated with RNAse G/E
MTNWKSFKQVAEFLVERPLNWMKSSDLKYIDIRIDIRTMSCIVKNRDGNLLDWDDFKLKIARMREEDEAKDSELRKSLESFYGETEKL